MTASKIVFEIGSLPDWIAAVSSTAGTIAVSLGVLVAFRGLHTWREQRLLGKRIDIAEEAVRGFARMKDIIIHVSNGAVWSGEIKEISDELLSSFPENEKGRIVSYIAPSYRINKYSSEIEEFLNNRYIIGAYFGQNGANLYERISAIIRQIQTASQMLADHRIRHEERGSLDANALAFWEEQRQKIWMGSNPEHPLHIELLSTVSEAVEIFGRWLHNPTSGKLW